MINYMIKHRAMDEIKHNELSRRNFVSTVSKATAAGIVLSQPIFSMAGNISARQSITVGDVMDMFIKEVPGAPFENTVDTLKSGNREIIVKGIVTTMFATLEVIEKTISLGANFIIAHEPTFYNHADETSWLKDDEVYQYKKSVLEKNQIAVWRNHDYVHRLKQDGVLEGLVKQLEWKNNYEGSKRLATIKSLKLASLIQYVKKRLSISTVRYIGDLSMNCSRLLLMPGAAGGRRHIDAIREIKPDVIFCGEVQEWETAEYIRDARKKGQKIALVVLGHADSEEPGSEFMERWLNEKFSALKVHHIPSKNPFSFL